MDYEAIVARIVEDVDDLRFFAKGQSGSERVDAQITAYWADCPFRTVNDLLRCSFFHKEHLLSGLGLYWLYRHRNIIGRGEKQRFIPVAHLTNSDFLPALEPDSRIQEKLSVVSDLYDQLRSRSADNTALLALLKHWLIDTMFRLHPTISCSRRCTIADSDCLVSVKDIKKDSTIHQETRQLESFLTGDRTKTAAERKLLLVCVEMCRLHCWSGQTLKRVSDLKDDEVVMILERTVSGSSDDPFSPPPNVMPG